MSAESAEFLGKPLSYLAHMGAVRIKQFQQWKPAMVGEKKRERVIMCFSITWSSLEVRGLLCF